ncbi:MAG: hypothetical protein AAF602_22055, partial [Myxococcota bacterium]
MRGLVRELQRSPGDETLWLVLADALLDRGDLRGELITLRHRLSHERLSVEQIDAIAWRIDEVEQQDRRRWQQDIAELPSAMVRWKDGFVDGLQLAWSPHAQEHLAEWLAHPSGELITSLDFVDDREIGNDEAQTLSKWPELQRLTELGLRRTHVGAMGAIELATSPHLARLQQLDLRGNHIQIEGLRAIVATASTRALSRLDIGHNGLGEGAASVIGRAALPTLSALDLSHNRIGNDGVRLLSAPGALPALRELVLGTNDIDGEGARALAHAQWWPQLESLTLSQNRLGDPGAAALA